jgi:type IV pilus assembly protein PilM
MSALDNILGFLKDPPPEFVFEIAADGIAMSRTRPPATLQHVALPPGVIEPSPVKENILDPAAFAGAVRKLVPPEKGQRRRRAALILPDNCVRIAVLDFETLPAKEEERRPLINFRLRKSVPFDIDDATVSYFEQGGKKVIVALAPSEILAHYEIPFRAAGLHPGLVTVSSLAMLDLFPVTGSVVIARLSPGSLTVIGLKDGIVTIVRSIELAHPGDDTEDPLTEIIDDIYPTLAYIEDQTGARPDKLLLVGFGDESEMSAMRLSIELEISVETVDDPWPGLAGYLKSLAPAHPVPSPDRKGVGRSGAQAA